MGSFTKKMKLTICLLTLVSAVYSSSDADVCDKNVCIKNLFSNLRPLMDKRMLEQSLAIEDKFWEYLPLIQNLNIKDLIERLFKGEFGSEPKSLFVRSFLNPQQILFEDLDHQQQFILRYIQPLHQDGPPMTVVSNFSRFEWTLLYYLDMAVRHPSWQTME